MTCGWAWLALTYSLFLLAGRRLAGAGRWDLCAAATTAAYLALETLGWLGIVPTMHWLVPYADPGRLRLGLLLACLSVLAVHSLPDLRFDPARRPWLLALLPVVQQGILLAAGRYGMDNGDSYAFIRSSFIIYFQGLDAFRAELFHRLAVLPFLLELLWWAPFRVLGYLGVPMPMAAMLAGRALEFCFMEVALFSTYFLGSEVFGKETGFWGAFLLGVCAPAFSFYGSFYFKDMPSAAVGCLVVFCFCKAATAGKPALGALAGALWCACLGLSWNGLYLVVPLAAVWSLAGGRRTRAVGASCLAGFLAAAILGILAVAGGSPGLASEVGARTFQKWTVMFHAYSGHRVRTYMDLDWESTGLLYYLKHLEAIVGAPVFLLAGVRSWGGAAEGGPSTTWRPRAGLVALAVWMGGLVLFLSLFPSKDERWLMLAFPAFALLGGQGFAVLRRRAGGRAAFCAMAPMVVLSVMGFASLLDTPWMSRDFFRSSEVYRFPGGKQAAYSAMLCRAATARIFSKASLALGTDDPRVAGRRAQLLEEIAPEGGYTPYLDADGNVIPGGSRLPVTGPALQPASFAACASRLDEALAQAGVGSAEDRRRAREDLSAVLGRPD